MLIDLATGIGMFHRWTCTAPQLMLARSRRAHFSECNTPEHPSNTLALPCDSIRDEVILASNYTTRITHTFHFYLLFEKRGTMQRRIKKTI